MHVCAVTPIDCGCFPAKSDNEDNLTNESEFAERHVAFILKLRQPKVETILICLSSGLVTLWCKLNPIRCFI